MNLDYFFTTEEMKKIRNDLKTLHSKEDKLEYYNNLYKILIEKDSHKQFIKDMEKMYKDYTLLWI